MDIKLLIHTALSLTRERSSAIVVETGQLQFAKNAMLKYPVGDMNGQSPQSITVTVPQFCQQCGAPYPWVKRKERNDEGTQVNEERTLNTIRLICSKFHLFALQLSRRHSGRTAFQINDEYDVQDLLHAILRLFFDDVRVEEVAPSTAGASPRMDFLLKDEQIAIEAKKTRSGLHGKEVGDQILVDIARYANHSDCRRLICLVYDPDNLVKNPEGLKKDLIKQSTDKFAIEVYIVPEGK